MPDDLVGVGTVAERLTREARELVRDFLAPATRELGEYLADRMRIFRAPTKAVRIALEQIEASRIPRIPIEPRVLVSA